MSNKNNQEGINHNKITAKVKLYLQTYTGNWIKSQGFVFRLSCRQKCDALRYEKSLLKDFRKYQKSIRDSIHSGTTYDGAVPECGTGVKIK